MPVPLAVGLAAFVELVLGKIALFMAFMFAKKVGLAVLGVGALVTISTALYSVLAGVVIPLATALFATSYGSIFGLAFPPIAGTCILGIMSVWSACGLYSYQRAAIAKISGV